MITLFDCRTYLTKKELTEMLSIEAMALMNGGEVSPKVYDRWIELYQLAEDRKEEKSNDSRKL